MNAYATIVQALGTLTIVAAALAVGLLLALWMPSGRQRLRATFSGRERHPIAWAFFVALVAMAGSLYLSDGVGLLPCKLCWFQRIAMYPLVLVLGVGLLRGDAGVWRFALPLPLVGLLISGYHVALQYQPSLDLISCGAGGECSVRYLLVFGFVSIPVMAGGAFLLITALLLAVRTVQTENDFDASSDFSLTV